MKATLAAAYDDKFTLPVHAAEVGGTKADVKQFVHPPEQHRTAPIGATRFVAAPDDADLSD